MEAAQSNFKKKFGSGQRNLTWKKGGLAVSKTTLHWEVARNKGLLNLFYCHLAISWSWVGYHTSSERGISGLTANSNILNFFKQIAIFKHVFELGQPHQSEVQILGCHIATSYSRQGYHTSFERWYSVLSYDTKYSNIIGEITLFWTDYTFKWICPCIKGNMVHLYYNFVQKNLSEV